MDTLLAASPAMIGLVLGLVAAYITLNPVAPERARSYLVAFALLTLLAMGLTYADRRVSLAAAGRTERDLQGRLDDLKGKNVTLQDSVEALQRQNIKLQQINQRILSEAQHLTARASPEDVENQRILREQIGLHLQGLNAEILKIRQQDALGHGNLCADVAIMYRGVWSLKSQELIRRAAALKLLPPAYTLPAEMIMDCSDVDADIRTLGMARSPGPR